MYKSSFAIQPPADVDMPAIVAGNGIDSNRSDRTAPAQLLSASQRWMFQGCALWRAVMLDPATGTAHFELLVTADGVSDWLSSAVAPFGQVDRPKFECCNGTFRQSKETGLWHYEPRPQPPLPVAPVDITYCSRLVTMLEYVYGKEPQYAHVAPSALNIMAGQLLGGVTIPHKLDTRTLLLDASALPPTV